MINKPKITIVTPDFKNNKSFKIKEQLGVRELKRILQEREQLIRNLRTVNREQQTRIVQLERNQHAVANATSYFADRNIRFMDWWNTRKNPIRTILLPALGFGVAAYLFVLFMSLFQ